jgi:ornithine carbamoyltransferase
MNGLLDTKSLTFDVLQGIFSKVKNESKIEGYGCVACSFQGTGTRTRTTFIQALRHLGLNHIDLPVFLDTKERTRDLAGYLDHYYDLYIVRYNDHTKCDS